MVTHSHASLIVLYLLIFESFSKIYRNVTFSHHRNECFASNESTVKYYATEVEFHAESLSKTRSPTVLFHRVRGVTRYMSASRNYGAIIDTLHPCRHRFSSPPFPLSTAAKGNYSLRPRRRRKHMFLRCETHHHVDIYIYI